MQDPAAGARWEDVRIFLAVYRLRALAAAGGRLGVDASTVSRRLVALETATGTRLFDRTREGLVPTRAAELLLPSAEAMEAGHGRFVRDASGVERETEGVVRLSAPPGLADAFVVPALVRLRERYPKIRIEIDASVRPVDLTRREADLALRSVPPQGNDLVVTKVTRARWIAVTSPERAKSLGRIATWEDVPWIDWDADLASLPAARWLARHVPQADVVLRTSHFQTQIAAAELGMGAVLVAEPYLEVRKLAPLRFAEALAESADQWPVDDLWLVGHRALRDVPRVAAVWSFVLDELGGTARSPSGVAGRKAGRARRT